jgi:hypothetical protein
MRDFDYEPVTDSSREIQLALAQRRNFLEGSASDWFPSINAALVEIESDCAVPHWDGAGSVPISKQTIEITAKIAEALYAIVPVGTPAPEIIGEPDGEISVSWSVAADRLYSLSVGAHGKINFAGQFGKEGGIHGWQPTDAANRSSLETSLQEIAKHIERLYPPIAERRASR